MYVITYVIDRPALRIRLQDHANKKVSPKYIHQMGGKPFGGNDNPKSYVRLFPPTVATRARYSLDGIHSICMVELPESEVTCGVMGNLQGVVEILGIGDTQEEAYQDALSSPSKIAKYDKATGFDNSTRRFFCMLAR